MSLTLGLSANHFLHNFYFCLLPFYFFSPLHNCAKNPLLSISAK